jgi:hypothetical protein
MPRLQFSRFKPPLRGVGIFTLAGFAVNFFIGKIGFIINFVFTL